MIDSRADASTALQVLAVEDAYDTAAAESPGGPIASPPLDARLAKDWAIAGTIVGTDSLWRRGVAASLLPERTVFYGWLLKGASGYRLLFRGTAALIEWAEDAEGEPIEVPGLPGKLERGFYGIYASMRLRRPGASGDLPLVSAVTSIVGGGSILVAGHSLGAALATMAAADLADPSRLGKHVSLRAYCSPHPGDGLYAQWADARIEDARGYANILDIVTHVPAGLGYAALPRTMTLWPVGKIKLNPFALHHVLSCAYLIDPEALDLGSLPPIDKPYIDCLRLNRVAA